MDASHKHNIQWRKPDTKEYIFYASVIRSQRPMVTTPSMVIEIRSWLPGAKMIDWKGQEIISGVIETYSRSQFG